MIATAPPDAVWITWEVHRRTRETSRRLAIPLVELVTDSRGVRRYVELVPRTILALARQRPRVLVVQNPSLVLACLGTVLRPFFGFRLFVDAHNVAVEPYPEAGAVTRMLTLWALRTADCTIVTNRYLVEKVEAAGGRAIVLPDPLPDFRISGPAYEWPPDSHARVVLVATFAPDEPVREIFEAVSSLIDSVTLYVTGRPNRLPEAIRSTLPSNVTLTGFLDDTEYISLIRSADLILDLTTKSHCLVCGAYEAVAVGTPMILSDDPATREYFCQGVVYSTPDSDGIRAAIEVAVSQVDALRAGVLNLREEMKASWPGQADRVRAAIAVM